MKEKLKQVSDYEWELPKEGKMNVKGLLIGNKAILDGMEDDTIGQDFYIKWSRNVRSCCW